MTLTQVSRGFVKQELLSFPFRNVLINGGFDVWQSGESFFASGTSTTFIADKWRYGQVTTGSGAVTLSKGTGDGPKIGANYLRATIDTAQASISSNDRFSFYQHIEGTMARKLALYRSSISFYIRSSMAGTLSLAIRLGDATLSIVFPIVIQEANKWEFKEILGLDPFNNVSTLVYDKGLFGSLVFSWSTGSNWNGSEGQWVMGNKLGLAGTNFMATAGTTIDIAEVQLEPGRVATPFEYRPISIEESLCKRYFERIMGARVSLGWPSIDNTLDNGLLFYIKYHLKRDIPSILIEGNLAYRRSNWVYGFIVNMVDVSVVPGTMGSGVGLKLGGLSIPTATAKDNCPGFIRLDGDNAYIDIMSYV